MEILEDLKLVVDHLFCYGSCFLLIYVFTLILIRTYIVCCLNYTYVRT